MTPWQALIAEKTKPNRAEYEVARRIDPPAPAPAAKPEPRKAKPAISVDEWLRALPPSESYQTWRPTPIFQRGTAASQER